MLKKRMKKNEFQVVHHIEEIKLCKKKTLPIREPSFISSNNCFLSFINHAPGKDCDILAVVSRLDCSSLDTADAMLHRDDRPATNFFKEGCFDFRSEGVGMIGTFDIRSIRKVDGFRIGTRGGFLDGTLERDRRRLVSTLRRGLECSLVVFLRSIFEGGCVLLSLLLVLND